MVPIEVKKVIDQIEELDYLIAPIADNRVYQTINDFINGLITDEACLHAISLTDLGKQYVFKTMKAINCLECLDRLYLCKDEKEHYKTLRNKKMNEYISQVKMAFIEYRRKGKYFDELFGY